MATIQLSVKYIQLRPKRISTPIINHQINNYYIRQNEHRYRRKRNVSFHGRYGKNEYLKTKSHSLNAILEELYTFGPEDYPERLNDAEITKIEFDIGKPLIPRIKLKRTTRSLKEEKNYKTLCKMSSSESDIILAENSANGILKKENDTMTRSENNITILLNDQNYHDISNKSDENNFTKNFDDCIKRLQQIEKDHQIIENEDMKEVEFVEKYDENMATREHEYKYKNEYDASEDESRELKSENGGDSEQNSAGTETTENCTENEDPAPTSWYSNLKQQFEKSDTETREPKTKEMSCRITGATLKNNQSEKTKSEEEKEKDTRHYFSRLVKTNKSLIDEELPDPDKVKHIRAMFQETLNSTLKRKLDKKLGGSLQNISYRSSEQQMSRPLSAQCCRNELFSEGRNCVKSDEEKDKNKPLRDGNGEFQIETAKRKLFEKYEKELKPGKETRSKRILQPKWTDTGSVSSGISSDLSSYDTDLESYSREGTEQDEITVSDDDLLEEVKDKHYVQNEVLEKIRSFGTSVTYYGGEMITCSVGPLLSPTTQAIMEEIGDKTSPIRSFDEFYRKYVETNDHSRKKKLGRTRSFGQNDVFQKPNVLSNTEIELYKNDLEIEIGIKKPTGIPQNSLKRKVTKSASLGCKPETVEKQPEVSTESNPIVDSTKENVTDAVNKDVAEDVSPVANPTPETETRIDEVVEKSETDEVEVKEKSAVEKDRFYARSKSAPEGFSESKSDAENPAKEIYFSYEKSIFNKKPKSDMEFEEFEVCESLSEKLEKLEKINSMGSNDDELQQPNENTIAGDENANAIQLNVQEVGIGGRNDYNHNERKELKYNYTKWPIETSVMVDIQKNSEQTPKIISSGKTVAKTKIRLF